MSRDKLKNHLRTAWLWGVAFVMLLLAMAAWVPPTNWSWLFVGLAFLVAAIPVALIALRFRFVWIELPLLAVLLTQTWVVGELSSDGLPGFELFFPLCVTGAGTYLFMYATRQWILRWLEQKGAI